MKPNLLLVGDYNRKDFLYAAEVLHDKYNIYFLEFLDKSEIKSLNYRKWGMEIFWKDYKDALNLIEKIKPEKVLFYFIESLNHVALNVACKYSGIITYHIEHGIRNYEYLEKNKKIENMTAKQVLLDKVKKLKKGLSRIRNRQFFLNTIKKLPKEKADFLRQYFKIRRSHSIWETFSKVNNLLRVADCYISFSSKIFEFHKISDHLPDNYPVCFTGCPSFDYLSDWAHIPVHGTDILFIDQAFERQQLFGWNEEGKADFLNDLINFAKAHTKKIWIKKHPYSSGAFFQKYTKSDVFKIISNEEDFRMVIGNCKIILGFFSTLLMPFMAMDHTVCFSLEMHPAQPENSLSSFLVETGAIKEIDSWEELAISFDNLDIIYREQRKKKQQFINDWMYRFDGKSSERLRKVLIKDEAV